MKDLVFLTRQMEDIDREKLELNDLKNWISSENLLIIYDSTKKIKTLNQFKDPYLFFVFYFFITLIGFLRIR